LTINWVTLDNAIVVSVTTYYTGDQTMKLKFNEYGWIKCFEMVADGQGGYFNWKRFDTKAAALRWVRENPEMRAVCAECQQ
jgi:hypothetical protein